MQVAKIRAKNILSRSKIGSGGYAINPYVGCPHGCIYCYAEFMRGVTGHEESWGEFLDAKEFDTASLVKFVGLHGGERVFMSSVTDCYNSYEARFGVTRKSRNRKDRSDKKAARRGSGNLYLRRADFPADHARF